jgi:hypothetical protein
MSNVSSNICVEQANLVCCMGQVTVGNVEVFSDTDYAGNIRTRQSTSGVVAVHAGCAIAIARQAQ